MTNSSTQNVRSAAGSSSQPINDTVLEEFRKEWKIEVESKKLQRDSTPVISSVESSEIRAQPLEHLEETKDSDVRWIKSKSTENQNALDIYIQAIAFEREGNMGEALIRYQQAFKLDRHVDYTYKKHYNDAMREATTSEGTSSELFKHFEQETMIARSSSSTSSTTNDSVYNLIETLRDQRLEYEPLEPNKNIPIAKLPNELILCILKQLLLFDIASVGRFSLVCKKFLLLTRENSIWRFVCLRAFHLDPRESIYILQKDVMKKYNNDWHRMFIERPRIRYDGAYIALCYYLRPGSTENVWNQPIHLVSYYRFIRFFSDGTCIKLQSFREPKAIIRNFGFDYNSKDLLTGCWEFDENTSQVNITLTETSAMKHTRYIKLSLKSTERGKHNKLVWNEYYSINNLTGEKGTFNLRNDKNFIFSKVKSFGMGW
ncbi:4432_t:CDS:2 [Ambispora gerdemannii]|uniref:4432_t:CDS:1 n=1 Tax=Ambispora gerdemannii TaxID=144530 RepID=A0A9N9GT83_9GLOM|nr:4432_t:CDS:2 [Ambispora gerdemannii]